MPVEARTGTDVLACIHDLIVDLQAKGHTIELLDDDRRRRGMGWLWWGSSWRSSRL